MLGPYLSAFAAAVSAASTTTSLVTSQHPDFREEEAPEWLVDVPDPTLAEEWEMLSFYRFVDIEQPEAFANMLQVGGHGGAMVATN